MNLLLSTDARMEGALQDEPCGLLISFFQFDAGAILFSMDVYHLPTPDEMDRDEALGHAWDWLAERRNRNRLVIVPVRDSVEHSRVLSRIASQVRTETARTFWKGVGSLREASVLVVWPSKETLQELQERQPAEVLVVPWRVEESDAWLRAHSSTPLAGGPALDKPTIADPVVLEAMKSLTNFINPRNNLVTYDDRDYAIETLRALVGARRRVNPDELYEWSLANGWTGKGAQRLQVLATEILAGKRHRTHSPPMLRSDIITRWEDKAGQ
jgi:hypothetical protein